MCFFWFVCCAESDGLLSFGINFSGPQIFSSHSQPIGLVSTQRDWCVSKTVTEYREIVGVKSKKRVIFSVVSGSLNMSVSSERSHSFLPAFLLSIPHNASRTRHNSLSVLFTVIIRWIWREEKRKKGNVSYHLFLKTEVPLNEKNISVTMKNYAKPSAVLLTIPKSLSFVHKPTSNKFIAVHQRFCLHVEKR